MNSARLKIAALALAAVASPLARSALTQLLVPPVEWGSTLSGISGDGTTLILTGFSEPRGWIWRETTGFVALPDANYPWHGGISDDGSLVVGSIPGAGAFRYNTALNQFTYPPNNTAETQALAISGDGATVVLSTPNGVFLWKGEASIQISTLEAANASISNDGLAAVLVLPSGSGASVWTASGGLQQLTPLGYVGNALMSADGSRVVAQQYQSYLRIWHIEPDGIVHADRSLSNSSPWITGASPDCSIVGLAGNPWSPSVWNEQAYFLSIRSLLAMQGASFPFDGPFSSFVGTSESKRILTGNAYLASPDGVLAPRIWLVSLDRSCPGELTFDARVDDDDFVQFAAAYDAYACPDPEWGEACPADFNHDRSVDDADFSIFASAYDTLECP